MTAFRYALRLTWLVLRSLIVAGLVALAWFVNQPCQPARTIIANMSDMDLVDMRLSLDDRVLWRGSVAPRRTKDIRFFATEYSDEHTTLSGTFAQSGESFKTKGAYFEPVMSDGEMYFISPTAQKIDSMGSILASENYPLWMDVILGLSGRGFVLLGCAEMAAEAMFRVWVIGEDPGASVRAAMQRPR